MEMRRKNFKENKQNSSSMAEFTKNAEQSFRNTPDLDLRTKVRQLEIRLNSLAEAQKSQSQKNCGHNLMLEGQVSLVEKQLALLDRDRTRLSNNEVPKQSRVRLSLQRSLKAFEKAESSEITMMDLTTQKEELRIQKMKCEQLQSRQLRLEQDVKDLLDAKMGRNCIKQEMGGLQAQRSWASKQIKYQNQLYSKSRTEATQKIEILSHGLEQSLATFKEDLNNFKREESIKLDELKGTTNGQLRHSIIYEKDQTAQAANSDLSSWKKSIEMKINRLCEEITCSMKGSKQYWRKEHDELAKDNLQTAKTVIQMRQALSKKLEKEVKGVTAVMSEEFNTFMRELEQTNDLIALAKKELQTKIQSESNHLKQRINQTSSFAQSRMEELQTTISKSMQDSIRYLQKEITRLSKQTNNQIESVASIEQSMHKVGGKTNDDAEKFNKVVQSLKIEVEGKLKAAYNRMMLDWTVKKQFEEKAKAEQAKIRQLKNAELQKKLADLSGKIKIQLRAEFSKKAERNSKEESEGINKLIEKHISQLKKEMQAQMQEDKKIASEEMNRLRFDMKAKEQMYNPENSAKRENERKKKEEQLRLKLQSITSQIKENSGKFKAEIQAEVGRLKISQHQEVVRIKNGLEGNIRLVEESIKRKEGQAKIKEQQLKRRQAQSNNLQQQFDHKLKSLKIQLEEYIVKGHGRLKTEVDGKIVKTREQVKALGDKIHKDYQEIILQIEQVNHKGDQIKANVDGKFAELKGISLSNMKTQEDEARNAQEKKMKDLRDQLCMSIDTKAERTQSQLKLLLNKMDQLQKQQLRVKTEVGNFLVANQNAINQLQVSHFSEKQKNKAVYDKMSTDILDITDSLTVLMSELKPPQK